MDKDFVPDSQELNEARKLLWESYLEFLRENAPSIKTMFPERAKEFAEAADALLTLLAKT